MKAAAKTRTSRQPSVRPRAVKGHAPVFREIVGLATPSSKR